MLIDILHEELDFIHQVSTKLDVFIALGQSTELIQKIYFKNCSFWCENTSNNFTLSTV